MLQSITGTIFFKILVELDFKSEINLVGLCPSSSFLLVLWQNGNTERRKIH